MTLAEEALRRATEARDRLLDLQHQVERARVDYNDAIRRLHAGGGSLREIAESLGISHQRVHQIVESVESAEGPVWEIRRASGGPLFSGFRKGARRAIVLAQGEARGLGHGYIGTEHILLGLLAMEEGPASEALSSLGVTADAVREKVVEVSAEGEESGDRTAHEPARHIPFTSQAKQTLELALRAALARQDRHIGAEHILLGLVSQTKSTAVQLLADLGVSEKAVETELDRISRAER